MTTIIERRPILIIAAWILILIISSPLTIKLNDIVISNTENFLPSTAESVMASKELEKIVQETGSHAIPDYLIVVRGIQIDYQTYKTLKDYYKEYKSTVEGDVYSWLDVIQLVEENLTATYQTSINNITNNIEKIIMLNEYYNYTEESIYNLSLLINNTDFVYSQITNNSKLIIDNYQNMTLLINTTQTICTQLLPLTAKTYLDVVRAEALIEALTDAYTLGILTENDINLIINVSNITVLGPLDPNVVLYVYNTVSVVGGPEAFSNSLATNITSQLILQDPRLTPEAKNLVAGVLGLWSSLVVNDVDHRSVILNASDPVTGQLLLAERIGGLEAEARGLLPGFLAGMLTPSQELYNVTLIIINETINNGCAGDQETILENSIVKILTNNGLPEDVSTILARHIVGGGLDSEVVANLSISIVVSKAGVSLPDTLREAVIDTIVRFDPNGEYTLYGANSLVAASMVVAEMSNITLTQDDIASIESMNDAGYAAYLIVRHASGEAAGIVDALWSKGLLGAGRDEILNRLDEVLGPLLAGMGVPEDVAGRIINASVSVYLGEDYDTVVSRLVEEDLERIVPDILSDLEGLLVEKGMNGFLVLYWPPPGVAGNGVEYALDAKDGLVRTLESGGFKPESVLLGGEKFMNYEAQEAAREDIERSDRLSAVFVIIVLALVLESIAAVLLPFVGIGFGLVAAMAIVYLLGQAGIVDVTTHSRTIMFSTGLGLGIDYAAYVAKRFREAMGAGRDPRRAAAEAYRLSKRPVMAGAAAAMIGFGSMLLATGFPFVASIGSNVPVAIALVMAASLTFIPALLALVGGKSWFWWPRTNPKPEKNGFMLKLGRAISSKPLAGILLVLVLTAASGMVVKDFEGSYDLSLNLPPWSESRQALETMREYYDPGAVYPVYVVASDSEHAQSIAEALGDLGCVSRAFVVEDLEGRVVQVILSVDPTSSEGVTCTEQVRSVAHSLDPESLVGGISAVNLDLRDAINNEFYGKVYPAALALMFIAILVAYGGVAVALASILSVSLAALWATSAAVVLYQYIYGQEVLWFLPVIVFTAILGVGMDYNSFYLARAREECWKRCSREGVAWAVAKGSGLVVGLAVIMASAYLGLALTETPGLSQMGLALVLGVLLAGANAALILTPSLLSLLGRRAWWPSRPGAGTVQPDDR